MTPVLKIYSENYKYEPIVLNGAVKQLYTIGRLELNDIPISDKMLSRIHCTLSYSEKGWTVTDGNETGQESTNGTWIFAYDEMEISDGMQFKSNSCNFTCYYRNK